MSNNQFLSNLEYIFIFDYYDSPLFFISQDKTTNKYYLFYSIDENSYFFSELSSSDTDYLFKNPDGLSILNHLMKKDKLRFIYISEDSYCIKELAEYENYFNEKIEDALPLEKFNIEFEYINKVSFSIIQNNYTDYLIDLYNTDQLTLRIKNETNSNKLDIAIIYDALNFVKNTWEDISERYTGLGNEKKLMMFAPSSGSLKLKFELDTHKQTEFFKNEASFSKLVTFINDLSYTPIYDDIELINERKLIKETSKLYEIIEKNNLSIEFLSNEIELGSIQTSKKIKDNLNYLEKRVAEELMKKSIKTENIKVEGEVLAANKNRNYFKISVPAIGDLAGIFEKKLFEKIKNSDEQITISKSIKADITKQTITNLDTGEETIKYILNSFQQ